MRIGIDVGGTKLEGIAISADGAELARIRVPSPRGSYEATLRAVCDLVRNIENKTGRSSSRIGIGIPGALSPATGLVKNANSTWLIGHPFDRDIAAALARPTRLANDADCFTLSEAVDGAAQGADTVFGVILGTGVGGGIAINGQLLRGRNAIAGEWGHNPLPWPKDDERPGPPCYCGKSGCIETWLSGPGLQADHERATGIGMEAAEIVRSMTSGNQDAHATLHRYADRLARGLATIINILDPEIIVLGGGVSNISALYELVPERLPHHVFSDRVDTRVVKSRHGDSSGVRGAAWLWSSEEVMP